MLTLATRPTSAKKYNVDDFQFSQAYPMFYDHLNKANVFLESIIELAEEKLDARIVRELLSDPVEGMYISCSCATTRYSITVR